MMDSSSPLPTKRRLLVVLACVLFVASAYAFRPYALDEAPIAVVLALLGGLVLGVVLVPTTHIVQTIIGATSTTSRTFSRNSRIVRAVLTLSGVALIGVLVWAHNGQFPAPITATQQFAVLVIGSGLLVLGMDGVPFRHALARLRAPARDRDALWLTVIVVLACFLRAVDLEYNVPRLVDEVHSISALTRLWEGYEELILLPHGTVTAFTWVYPLLQNESVNLFGANLTGLRAVSAIFGTCGVIALWLLARELFDRKTALFAALMLATFPPHIHFSRIGINNIVDPLFGTLCLYFLVRGLRGGWGFALAGVLLGFTQYFYEGGRLLYPALTGVFLLLWLFTEWRAGRRVDWRGLGRFVGAFLLIALPVYLAVLAWEYRLTPRLQDMRVAEDLYANSPVERFILAFWTYAQRPPEDWFYSGNTGLVLVPVLPFFMAGFWVVFWRSWRAPYLAFLLVWLAATAFGNSLLFHISETARYVVAFPAIVILVALGGHVLTRMLVPKREIVFAVIGVLLAGVQVYYYFGLHVERYNDEFWDTVGYDDVLWRMGELPPYTHAHMLFLHTPHLDDYNVQNLIAFRHRLADVRYTFVSGEELTFEYLQGLDPYYNHAFFVRPIASPVYDFVRNCCSFSEPVYSSRRIPPEYQYAMFFIPAAHYTEHAPVPVYRPPTPLQQGAKWLVVCAIIAGVTWITARWQVGEQRVHPPD